MLETKLHVEGLCCGDEVAGHGHHHAAIQRAQLLATIVSGAFVGIGLACHWLGAPEWARIPAFGLAVISGGWFIAPKALAAARRFSADMNLLMSIAAIGAMCIGAWSEAGTVVFLFSLAELLESYSVTRARRAIEAVMDLAPETALLKRGEAVQEVPVAAVGVGDVVVVKPGARIPLDGVVIAGASSVNQAPITGESMPVEKASGSDVFAGSINQRGSLEVRTTRPASQSTLARIIHLVEEAQAQKAPAQRFVDVFARYYTPAAIVMAALVAVVLPLVFSVGWGDAFYRALVLLVIACPCALVISTPVSIVSGLTGAARKGVLIKGGVVLETLGKVRALALDKTGTITEGRPRVTAVVALNQSSPAELLRAAVAIEAHSEHPLADAILRHGRESGVPPARARTFESLPGMGARGEIDGHEYFVGGHRLAEEMAVCSPEAEQRIDEIENRGETAVVVGHAPHSGCKGGLLGVIAVGDSIRPGAVDAVRDLHSIGIRRIVMLTGDNRKTAAAVAESAGIGEIAAELLPEEKVHRVRELIREEQYVGMVGDGVNDAPALAASSVGIAMGVAGSDAALETADVALMSDDLGKLADAIVLGRRTGRTVRVNIALSIAIKAVFLVLATVGVASMWTAIAADTGVTFVVVANSLRLLK